MEPTTFAQSDPSPEPTAEAIAARGYEPMRLGARGLRRFVVWFVLGLAATFPIVWFVLGRLTARDPGGQRESVIDADAMGATGAAPLLQPSVDHDALPREDLARVRAGEDAVFEHLGWRVDPKTGEPAVPAAVVEAVARRAAAATTRATAPATKPREGGTQ